MNKNKYSLIVYEYFRKLQVACLKSTPRHPHRYKNEKEEMCKLNTEDKNFSKRKQVS